MMPSLQVPLYDALGADYDRFVDWKTRLAHELPFFEQVFGERDVHRVLDAACSTGRHAIALAQRGYQTVGADLSAEMIAVARQNALEAGVAVEFVVAGLGELAQTVGGGFDAVLCLGNSLPHLLTPEAVAAALADMATVLGKGGLLVIQNRNYDRVWTQRERFMPPTAHRSGDRETIFFRFMDFHADTMTFNMARFWRTADGWDYRVDATELRPILGDDLAAALDAAGFGPVDFYRDYRFSPFDPETFGDLIALARRK
jgi:glycine/sarcosine N-methyltransferase